MLYFLLRVVRSELKTRFGEETKNLRTCQTAVKKYCCDLKPIGSGVSVT